MTKQGFRNAINEAEKGLVFTSYSINIYYRGVCSALWMENNIPVTAFGNLFSPIVDRDFFWLGDRTEDNLELRQLFLSMFEQVCISEEYYKEF